MLNFVSNLKNHLSATALERGLLPLALLLLPCAVAAQTELEPVFVTATRTPQPQAAVLGDVSVIEREEIESSGVVSIADLLVKLPGIQMSRNGGPGAATSLFVRGGESRHTAVYLDGARVDSQTTTGGAMWERIPIELVERIEVLRGPAAAVYGSDAIAGVVQIFTRRGRTGVHPFASVTLGSQRTRQAEAGISGVAGIVDYAISAANGRSDGFDATTAASNPDQDGWHRGSAQARVGLQITPRQRVEATLLNSHLRARYDGFTPGLDDTGRNTLTTGTLSWEGQWSENSTTRVSMGQTRSTYETQPDYYRTETTLRNLLLQQTQRVGANTFTASYERREDKLYNPATTWVPALEGERHQDGVALGWGAEYGKHSLQLQARRDEDSEFGGKTTGSAAWGWRFAPAWRATASAATSFRVPTLYQRFGPYGNPDLVPERGRNIEVGLRRGAGDNEVSLVAWRNRVSNLISYGAAGPCQDVWGCYENTDRARLDGLTLAGKTKLGVFALRGSLDWQNPRNAETGKQLARRARHYASAGASTRWAGWTFDADLQLSGKRWDDSANTKRLGAYTLVNLGVSRPLGRGLTLQARLDNALDKHYELANGYATAGRSWQATLRWAL